MRRAGEWDLAVVVDDRLVMFLFRSLSPGYDGHDPVWQVQGKD
jgi:hypothetical protein